MKNTMYIPTLSEYSINELLRDCQNFQEMIYEAPDTKIKDEMGLQACEYLAKQTIALGSPKICTKGEYSFISASDSEKRNEQNEQAALVFDEAIVLEGTLKHIAYFRHEDNGFITWPIYEAEILNPDELYPDEIDIEVMLGDMYMPAERQIRIPVHMPVGYIDFARTL